MSPRKATFADDELSDSRFIPTPTVDAAVSTNNNNHNSNLPDLDGDEIEFGSEEFLSKVRLPRLKNSKNEVIRFFLVSSVKLRAKETHYVQGTGTYQCLKPNACPLCASGDAPRTRIVALGVKYVNADNKTGKLGNSKPSYEVGWVCLSRANHTQMVSVLEEGASVYTVDWKMGSSPRAFGYEFSVAASQAAYIKVNDQQVIAGLIEPYLDGIDLAKKLGKKASAAEMKAIMSGNVSPETASSLSEIDSLDN